MALWRATAFGPKPSLFLFVSFFFFCFCFVFCFGGFKGQVRCPKGPPHLALNPPNLFIFCFFWFVFVPFLSLLCNTKKNLIFPPRKGHFCLFLSVSLCSSLAFFGLPLFQVFLSLSLSSSCPFSLPSCLSFLLSFASLFLSLSFLFFLLCFCFMKRTTSERLMYKVFLHQSFLFFGFLSSFLFEIPFSYLCFFGWFKVMFLFNIIVFGFKKNQVEKHQFLVKRGVATKRFFFMTLCFAKSEKLSFFGGSFFGKFWLMFKKNTIK